MSERAIIVSWLCVAVAAVGFSAIFAGVETGVYCLNHIRLRLRSESGEPRAAILSRLMRHRRSLLATLLIGTNIANYVASLAIVGVCGQTRLAEWQIAVVVPVVLAPLLLIFAEIVPKNIFQSYSDRYTYSFARLIHWSRRLFLVAGLLPLVNAVTGLLVRLTHRRTEAEEAPDRLFHPRQQVRRMIREASHLGTLTPYQSYLVDRVMNLRTIRLAQIMVPLAKVRSVSVAVSPQQFREQLRRHEFSRMPVYRGRPGELVGVVNANAVIAAAGEDRPLSEFVYEVPWLKSDSPVVHALFRLQRARRAMAIVADKSGAPVGIVTIKDLVEEIVGDIEAW